MQITEIKIRQTFPTGKLRATVSVTFDEMLVLHDIRVIAGTERMFVSMPSRRSSDGGFHDIAHPITRDFRNLLEQEILAEYRIYCEKHHIEDQPDDALVPDGHPPSEEAEPDA